MNRNLKASLILSISWLLFLPGIAISEEDKKDQESYESVKAQIEKIPNKKCLPWIDERFYMMIIGPNCHSNPIDPEIIVKKTYDPNIHPELRIIDPYTRKEITGNKGPWLGSNQNKFQFKGKRYETLITGPAK